MTNKRWALFIGWLLSIAAGCATPIQMQLDAEVKRLCAIDGGVKVYERIGLAGVKVEMLRIPTKQNVQKGHEYYYEWKVQNIAQSGLQKEGIDLARSHFTLYRVFDGKLIGESIAYTRRGGDVPGPWNPSHLTCPEDSGLSALKNQVFISTP